MCHSLWRAIFITKDHSLCVVSKQSCGNLCALRAASRRGNLSMMGVNRKTAPITHMQRTSPRICTSMETAASPSFLLTSVHFRDGLGSTALSADLTSLSGDLDADLLADLACLSGDLDADLSADLTSLSRDVDTNDAELPEIREHRNNKLPVSVGEEVEFVAADDDEGLIQMMAGLGLPTTFGTSTEGRSHKQGRKVKLVSSKNFALRLNTTAANSEIAEEVGSLGPKLPNLTNETASRPQVSTQIATHLSDCYADEAQLSTEALESLVLQKNSEDSSKFRWEAVWDAHYQQYYYCNVQTWETTWDIPKGFEDHLNTSYWETSDSNGQGEAELEKGTEDSVTEILEQTEGDESKRDTKLKGNSPDFVDKAVRGGIRSDFSAGANQLAEARVLASSQENVDVSRHSLLSVEVRSQIGEQDVLVLSTLMERTLSSGSVAAPSQLGGENLERQEDSGVQRVVFEKNMLNQDYHGGLPQSCGTHLRFEDSDDESGHREELDVSQTQITSPCTRKSDIEMERKMGRELWSQTVPVVDDENWADEDDMISLLSARKRKRRLRRSLATMPTNAWCGVASSLEPSLVEEMSKRTAKYWYQRYRLFTRYDEGIKMDEEGWFSVTPESIAKHHASRMCSGLIIDAFTGVGGNAIQFALRGHHVIAIDIDPVKIEYAKHNAGIYGVADLIEFIVGDVLTLVPSLKADVVFLSPPWGGPSYLTVDNYDLHSMLQPVDGFKLFQIAQAAAPNLALFLPRNVDLDQLAQLSWLATPPLACEVEKNYVNGKLKAITAYYGEIATKDTP